MSHLTPFDPARHQGDQRIPILNALIALHNALDGYDLDDLLTRGSADGLYALAAHVHDLTHAHPELVHAHPFAAAVHTHPAGDAATLDGLDSTAFAPLAHTHPAGSVGVPYRQRCTANTAQSSSTTYSVPTGFTGRPVVAGKVYRCQAVLLYTTAAVTTGIRPCFTGPAMTDFFAVGVNQTAATATEMLSVTATAADLPFTAGIVAGTRCVIDMTCKPSANGTLGLQFRSEVNASAVTVQAGSYWLVEEVLEG